MSSSSVPWKLFALGIDPETPLDLAIARRATNVAAVGMTIVALTSAAASLLDAHSALLAAGCLAFAVAYATCLLLNAVGRLDASRWLLTVAGCLNYLMFNLAVGAAGGAPIWIIAGVVFPVTAYARAEQREAMIVYALLPVVFVVTAVLTEKYGPLVLPPERAQLAYLYTVVAIALLVGLGLHHYKNSSIDAHADLDAARARIDELLDNMLPPSIVARLGQGEHVIADSHGEASVLFADLTGFSELTRRLSPTHLVEVLNRMFSRFDEVAARRGIEKIKTIGDCYMAATGVLRDSMGHAEIDAMADFALEIPGIVEELSREFGLTLGVRIGISTGAVVSGVIGTHRLNFDVWGETVNLARQMEMTGMRGRIQVSESTYWRLRGGYRFEPRGEVQVKAGGPLSTYFLLGRGLAETATAVQSPTRS